MPNEFYRKDRKRFDFSWMLRKLLRNKRLMLLLAGGLLVSGYVLFGSRGVVQRIRLKNQKAELQSMIQQAESDNRKLQAESKALDGDKKTIEKVAREKYGMVRDGETVYKVRKKE